MLRALAATLVLGVLASCAAPRSGARMPCEDCAMGVASVKKTTERRAFCVVDGRQVDCTKNPPECPKCAQATRTSPAP